MDDYTDWMEITEQEKQRKAGKFEEGGGRKVMFKFKVFGINK